MTNKRELNVHVGLLILVACVLHVGTSKAQEPFATLPGLNGLFPKDIQCIAVRDSIFLSFRSGDNVFTRWVLPDGRIADAWLTGLKDKLLCGITAHNNRMKTFYFLEQEKHTILIKAMQTDQANNSNAFLPGQLELSGIFIGSYTEGENLLIFSFEKGNFQLRVTTVKRLQISEDKLYAVSLDPGRYNRDQMTIIRDGSVLGSVQALAKVKIFIRADGISIVVDDEGDYLNEQYRLRGTTVIRLNKASGESNIKFFMDSTDHSFSSFLLDNYLFKARRNDISIFDVNTGKLLQTVDIGLNKSMKERLIFIKKGNSNRIWKNEQLYAAKRKPGQPYVVVNKDSLRNSYVLTWGFYEDERSMIMPAFGPAGIAAALIGAIVSNAVIQSLDGKAISRYFYMAGDPVKGFDFSSNDADQIVKQKIDGYEIAQQEKGNRYGYKGYFQSEKGIVAVYQNTTSNRLEFIVF